MAYMKRTATNRSTGSKTTEVKKATPVTKSAFTGATGNKVAKPLTKTTSAAKYPTEKMASLKRKK